MARHRTYHLPNGTQTSREASYNSQWTKFLKPFVKSLKLKIGSFNRHEAELWEMLKKGNGKSVPKARITLPHWLIWRIQSKFNYYLNYIGRLQKANLALRKQNRDYQQFFKQTQMNLEMEEQREKIKEASQ